ncbi:MAG: dehydrogenase [Clostridiales bacterium]|jgi:2-oxoisovalerate dehydrogenase E1 component|nr:dehydrogenase [Clostridiales bacterium]
MPKSQFVDPAAKRKAGTLKFKDIPLNRYNKTVADEKENFTKADFMGMLEDMLAIREFETMLTEIKLKGNYGGEAFTYPGPSHLSIGQEAQAVGQAYWLGVEDFIFGTHRSHHEVIAKAMSAIKKLPEKELERIMENEGGGVLCGVIRKNFAGESVKEQAKKFFLYGMMCELFAKESGFSKGLGGSMHAFFLPFGIFPNNAIVGGSAPIAAGVALYKKVNKKGGVVVANAGDGAVGCGPVYESMNFAAMDQYTRLWDQSLGKGGLPIIFNFNNNNYGMGGQTAGETMAYDVLARLGAGINPQQMHAERVDGYNVLAVIDAYKRMREVLKKEGGPVLLDVMTYRQTGHSTSDVNSYRDKEEIEAWKKADAIDSFKAQLVKAGVASQKEVDGLCAAVLERNIALYRLAKDLSVAPYVDFNKNPRFIESLMFSNTRAERMGDAAPDVLLKKEENPRALQIAGKARFAVDKDGKPVPKTKQYNIRDALFEAVFDKYYVDPTLVSYGEDVRDWAGAFGVYRGLTEAIPYHRLFNSPISEAAIVGSAVGYALAGGRVIAELMYCDFIGRAGDEVFNQMAKWQAMSAGGLKMPMVLRVSVGAKYGAQHSQDWTALTAHIPGLKVLFPVTPYDAKGLLNAALMGTDPVVFFESQRIYDMGETFHAGGVPEGYYEIPLGEPDVKRAGGDVTILTVGATLYRALEAAKILQEKYGVSAEVIDARSMVPFNYELVIESVKKTGRVLLTSDACARGSILAEMSANITQLAFDYLDAPPFVVGAENWITPAFEYDAEFFPQPDWIIDAIHQKLLPLNGHTPRKNYAPMECIRKAKAGV